MGMYDEVKIFRIKHEKFKPEHNGLVFQTKCLECEMMAYSVFNNELYIEAQRHDDGSLECHDIAIKSDHSGEVDIYTNYERDGVEYWVEYRLAIKDGVIIDILRADAIVRKDNRDLSTIKPDLPSNTLMVNINAGNLDKENAMRVADYLTDEKLQEIREVLGVSGRTATISFPAVVNGRMISGEEAVRNVMSVVQTMKGLNTDPISVTTPRKDRVLVIDEFWNMNYRPPKEVAVS